MFRATGPTRRTTSGPPGEFVVAGGADPGPGCAWALKELKRPALTSAIKTPARQKTEAIKTRRLKKADFEVDFFFMDEVELFPCAVEPRW
jgi:hypothetical protein